MCVIKASVLPISFAHPVRQDQHHEGWQGLYAEILSSGDWKGFLIWKLVRISKKVVEDDCIWFLLPRNFRNMFKSGWKH